MDRHPVTRAGRLRAVVGVTAATGLLVAACSAGPPASPAAPVSLGTVQSRPVPASVSSVALTDQHGRTFDLASLKGRAVLLVPFLTLCTDICPMDTANLSIVQHELDRSGQGHNVQIVEMTVDPGRDTVARLAAYAQLTGATWELVTETPAGLATISSYLGIWYQKVAEDDPPSIDWLTHQPLTYDINHSDGFILLGPTGDERFDTGAAPDYTGKLVAPLQHFLSDEGLAHQAHPEQPGWTAAQASAAVSWLIGAPVEGDGE